MQRTQRLLFSFQFGASLTFGCFPQGPERIARRIKRRAASTLRSAPRVLYSRPVGRVQKRPRLRSRQASGPHEALKKKRSKQLSPVVWSRPARCRRALMLTLDKLVTTLFISVNIMLAGYAGAGLATTARLKYDPTTYLVLREIFPNDLAFAIKNLPQASKAVLAMAHLAVVAVVMPRWLRFLMLMLYAATTAAALWEERRLWLEVWPGMEQRLREGRGNVLGVLLHMHTVLDIISQWHGYAWTLKTILWEFEKDSLMNVIVAKRAAKVFAALQVSGGVLAVLAALTGFCRAVRDRRSY